MFTKGTSKKSIDDEIEHVLKNMESIKDVSSEEYQAAAENLRILCDARAFKKPPRFGVEPEAIMVAATSLVEILVVLNYEQLHFAWSKAMNFIVKGRI